MAGGFSGTDVGTHGNVHADVAGDAGQHRAKHEAQRHKAGKGPSQKHGHDHAHDGDGFVLTVQVRLSAFLNSASNLLHFFRAGTGGEDALGGIIRIVEGEQPQANTTMNENISEPRISLFKSEQRTLPLRIAPSGGRGMPEKRTIDASGRNREARMRYSISKTLTISMESKNVTQK